MILNRANEKNKNIGHEIDTLVFELYGLTEGEIQYNNVKYF
jgi:hypothetical protein